MNRANSPRLPLKWLRNLVCRDSRAPDPSSEVNRLTGASEGGALAEFFLVAKADWDEVNFCLVRPAFQSEGDEGSRAMILATSEPPTRSSCCGLLRATGCATDALVPLRQARSAQIIPMTDRILQVQMLARVRYGRQSRLGPGTHRHRNAQRHLHETDQRPSNVLP